MHKHHAKPSVWCSSLRARPAPVSDSDSDSDAAAETVAKAETSDVRLMREMDLSVRHEAVEYRPNPWSIARINAASRPSHPKPALSRTPGPAQPPPKSHPKPIVEAFKKQAKRGPREVQPIVRDISDLGDNSICAPGVDKSCIVAKQDDSSAKKSRHGGVHTHNTTVAQARACPQRTELLDPHSPAHKPQIGYTVHTGEAFKKEKSTHTVTFSDCFIQSARTPLPFKPKRIFGTCQASRSSPVRLAAPQSAPDVDRAVRGYADRNRPTVFHHSSPGPRSHVPVSAHIMHPSLHPLVSAFAYPNSRPSEIPPASSLPGDMDQSTEPSRELDALDDGIYVSAPPLLSLTAEPRRDPRIRAPESKRRRVPSPELTPPRKNPRASASRPPGAGPPTTTAVPLRFPTAYAFGEDDDPDAEWSTLARTKRVEKRGGVRQSGRFRLPLLGLAPRTPTRASEAKQRVITYFPPPMAGKKQVDEVTAKIEPPPGGPAKHALVDIEEEEEDIEIRVMDSDVTLVNEDEEHVVGIDVDDVCVHYPAIRASMKAESRMRRVLGCVVELRV